MTIVLTIIAIVGLGQTIFWIRTTKEHNDTKNLPIAAINFRELNDGTYFG
ncbi:MAG TPA: hypothetical protein VEF53_15395 [Patescibacteria group bacterium]|nr:hypothetical protein [Patescibacteria group bacterium]